MSSHPASQHDPGWYEIRLQGRLDDRWCTWFDGMTLSTGEDPAGTGVITILRGQVVDQAALHGLLARLRDIGLPLVAVTRVVPPQSSEDHPAT